MHLGNLTTEKTIEDEEGSLGAGDHRPEYAVIVAREHLHIRVVRVDDRFGCREPLGRPHQSRLLAAQGSPNRSRFDHMIGE